jgi:outer membrane receptor protein involved in Fe transport
MNSKLSCAIAAVLGSVPVGIALADSSSETDTSAAVTIPEITVTAQRRTENIQNVPISIQALTAENLSQLNIQTFDDYIKYLPNVTSANNGPGQNEVFMRGLSAGSQASQGSGSTGLWPNVAIYLDNQSGQLPNRNLDLYAADLNRIEVLEGPQGTLFGAGAEAGAIRYITNEPKLDVTEGNVKAGYGVTAHGDPNADVTAVLNLPLIADTLAVRGVIYDDHRGGYIDNVPGTFTRKDTDIGIHYAGYPSVGGVCPDGGIGTAYCVPPTSSSINNYNLTGRAINPVTYSGIRVEALWKFNEDWNFLLSQSYQSMHSQGVFYEQPNASDGAALAPLEVTLFNSAYDKDRFESTAWTLNGKLGWLKAVYTGGYLVRKVDQTGDYTNYSRGVYADYYQCVAALQTCYSPSASWRSSEQNDHQQHEFRLSTPDDWRIRGIVGAFWEDNKLYDQTAWQYKTVPACTADSGPGNTNCLSNVGTIPGTTVQSPGVYNSNTSFAQDQVRETKQLAFFASADVDLIPKTLTLTLGTRHFRFDNSMAGSVVSSFGCADGGVPPTGCHVTPTLPGVPYYSYNLNANGLSDSESGFKSRGNLTWHITRDLMVYYTYSQGFRPGGFNQNGGAMHAPDASGTAQYIIPKSYSSDKLTNNEIGWKTEFLDHRVQFNGAIYRENWDNVQIEFFNPGVVGNLFYDTNGQNFLIKGIETQLVARVIAGLSVQASASWNQSKQTNSPALINNNPASPNFGKPITQVCPGGTCSAVTNPFGPIDAPSADAPPMQFSVRARYDWSIGGFSPYVQAAASHNDHAYTQAGSNPTIQSGATVQTSRLRFEIPAYTTYDASIGVAKDAWWANITGENITNSNAATFISTDQFIVAKTPLRPRVISVNGGFKF